MSKAIIYCEKCGKIVLPSEIDRGKAMVFENVGVCSQCVASLPPAEREEVRRRFSGEPDPISATRRGRTTTARKAWPPQTTEGAPVRPAAGHGSGRGLAVAGIVAGALTGVAIAVVLTIGRANAPSEGPDRPVARGGGGGGERETPRDPSAPVKTDARRRLDEIRSMAGPPLERYAEVRAALVEFTEKFDDPACLKEARGLLAKIDADFGAAADKALEKATKSARALAADGKFDEAKEALGDIRERFGESGWFETSAKEAIAEALGKIDAARSEAAKAAVARARKAFDSGKFAEARASLEPRAAWPEEIRARAGEVLKEIDEAEAKLKAQAKRKEVWEAFLLGFPDAGKLSLAKARAFLEQERKAFEKLGAGGEIAKKLDRIERRFREAKLVEELAEVALRQARGGVYFSWKGERIGGKVQGVEKGVLRLMTTRGVLIDVPIAEIAAGDVVDRSRIMRQGSKERLRAAAYLLLRGDLAAAREAIKDPTGDAASALREQIDEFVQAIEAREARLAAAKAKEAAEEAARAAAEAKAAAAGAAARESAALKAGLIGHWKFDDGGGTEAKDSSGKGHHGSVMGGAKWTTAGKLGGALEFDGRDGHVKLPEGFGDFTTGLTFAVWAKPTHAPGRWQRFVELADARRRCNILFARKYVSNDLRFEVYQGVGGRRKKAVEARAAIEQGVWQHFAVTMDVAGEAVLYKNGIEVAKGRFGLPKKVRRTVNHIGKSVFANDAHYNGMMDDVRIYARSLSAEEIRALFEGRKPTPEAVPTKGLVGHWKLDDRQGAVARDSSGNKNHGAIGGDAQWTQGKRGGALHLGGKNSRVEIVNEAPFDITGHITVAAWVKTPSFDRAWQAIVTKGANAWRLHRQARLGTLEWACAGLSHGRWGEINGRTTVDDGQWHHVAGVYDGTTSYLYVDGEVDASAETSGSINTTDDRVCIGHNAQLRGRNFMGIVDDVRIYKRGLSAEEIRILFEGRKPVPSAGPAGGLVGHWKLDDSQGTIARDSSGNGHDGTVKGDATWTTGRRGATLFLGGNDGHVEIANEPVFDITGDITVAAWVKAASFTKSWQAVVTKGDGSWRLHRNGDAGSLNWTCTGLDNNNDSVGGAVAVDDGRWHHAAGVYDGKAIRLYVDGKLDASREASGSIRDTGDQVCIGHNAQMGDRHFHGAIADVRIYSRALTADEIRVLFEGPGPAPAPGAVPGGAARKPVPPPVRTEPGDAAPTARARSGDVTKGLIAHWKFDEPGGAAKALDATANGYRAETKNVKRGVPGRIGKAYGFDGDGEVATTLGGCGRDDFTWSAWIKTTSGGNVFLYSGKKWKPSGKLLHVRSGRLEMNVCNSGELRTAERVDDDEWHHVALAVDYDTDGTRDTAVIYLDGKQEATKSDWDITKGDAGVHLTIGDAFKGAIDDVRVHERALTADEVGRLAAGGE